MRLMRLDLASGFLALLLAGCAALSPVDDALSPPRLLAPDEIALAAEGTSEPPDLSVLMARATALEARAARLRRLELMPPTPRLAQ